MSMTRRVLWLLIPISPLVAAAEPVTDDMIRLAEAARLTRNVVADTVWPGWSETPFPVLLVAEEKEYLIDFPRTPDGFSSEGYSSLLATDVLSRPRQYDPALLASFPAFGLPSTVVIGRAGPTGKRSTDWVLTVLHEHFHQYQYAAPDYFSAVERLDLANGDQTGMWMLNYPFPYQSDGVAAAFADLSRELAVLLRRGSTPAQRGEFWQGYRDFLAMLQAKDRDYFSLQVWQEGLARYFELTVTEAAIGTYAPSLEFRGLMDAEPLQAVADRMRAAMLGELENPDLKSRGRVSFYAFGAGLGLLLDEDDPAWKSRYLTDKFFIERYFAGAP